MPGESSSSDVDNLRTRRSLISRLRDVEDKDSWQEFFDTYWKLIFSVARRAGLSEQEAEDVVQETTVSVAKYIKDFQYDPKVCSFKSWLMHKTQWRIIDQVRKRPPRCVHSGPLDPALGESSHTDALDRIPAPESLELHKFWDEEWRKNLVDAAMDRIKRRVQAEHYQIFYLSAVRNLSSKRVAATMGVSIARVYLVRHRVGALIRKEVRWLESQRF